MLLGFAKKFAPLVGLLTTTSFICKEKNENKTYIWGNGFYQARPDALLQFQNFCPKLITNLPKNLVQLEFGHYFEAGIDSEGVLYIWDKHVIDSNLE